MPKIRMNKNAVGYEDGIHAKNFLEGQDYEVNDSLAKNFLSIDACVLVDGEPEKKSLQDAPKNKAHKSAPKNKSDLGDE